MVSSTGVTLHSSVLWLLDGVSDVWRNVGPSFSSSSALEVSDSAWGISKLVRARVRSVGPKIEGLLGSQKVPSLISGSGRVALFWPLTRGLESPTGADDGVDASGLGLSVGAWGGTLGFA